VEDPFDLRDELAALEVEGLFRGSLCLIDRTHQMILVFCVASPDMGTLAGSAGCLQVAKGVALGVFRRTSVVGL
jgi:hypothetical protein